MNIFLSKIPTALTLIHVEHIMRDVACALLEESLGFWRIVMLLSMCYSFPYRVFKMDNDLNELSSCSGSFFLGLVCFQLEPLHLHSSTIAEMNDPSNQSVVLVSVYGDTQLL